MTIHQTQHSVFPNDLETLSMVSSTFSDHKMNLKLRSGWAGILLLALTASCGYPDLKPEAAWPPEARSLAVTEVDLRWEYDLKVMKGMARGSGVIVHSCPSVGNRNPLRG